MIRLERVSKVYRRDQLSIPVLQNVDLQIADGEFLALMGPSGSGKTTLLNLIAGLDRPTSGRVVVGNRVLSEMKESELATWRSQNVGLVFQLYNLIPVFTALENVEFSLLLTDLDRKARLEHARTALTIVGLGDRLDHYPRQLSGGQEQRVAIARAIATDPALLVADEPTGDLDAKSAEEILGLLNRLNREFKKTIVMVTHDPRAASHAHRLVHLDKGALSRAEIPKREVDALIHAPSPAAPAAGARTPAAATLEADFLKKVLAAMSEYSAARAKTVRVHEPEELPPPDAFEGLTALDILELSSRLEDLFDEPGGGRREAGGAGKGTGNREPVTGNREPSPPREVRVVRPPGARGDAVKLVEKMLAEDDSLRRTVRPGSPTRGGGSH